MKACAGVSSGPSLGIYFVFVVGDGGGNAKSASKVSSLGLGNKDGNPKEDEDADKSMTPRWINNEGMTLSENIGRWSVRGIGNGVGVEEPNRRAMA